MLIDFFGTLLLSFFKPFAVATLIEDAGSDLFVVYVDVQADSYVGHEVWILGVEDWEFGWKNVLQVCPGVFDVGHAVAARDGDDDESLERVSYLTKLTLGDWIMSLINVEIDFLFFGTLIHKIGVW